MQGLSERQREILQYLHDRQVEDGVNPSYREIGDAMGIRSTNGVSDHLKALEKKGYVEWVGARGRGALARAVTLTPHALEALGEPPNDPELPVVDLLEIPVYGRVAAGALTPAFQQREETLRVDSCMVPGGGRVFALRVMGESMVNDGILPGDYLFVQKKSAVRNADIAVVMVEGECTVKRFYREGDGIRLQPANDLMKPIWIHASEWREVNLIGVVVGIYRRMH
jgi:repressor LexA